MDRSKNYIFLLPQINRIFFKDLWAELSRYNQINKLWTLKQKSVKTKAHNDSQNVMFTKKFCEKKMVVIFKGIIFVYLQQFISLDHYSGKICPWWSLNDLSLRLEQKISKVWSSPSFLARARQVHIVTPHAITSKPH